MTRQSKSPPNQAGDVPDTRHFYTEEYFQGGQSKSNYDCYIENSRGPSEILGETLARVFRPHSALDVGCAVGHVVKKLTELGVRASGFDISEWAVRQAATESVSVLDFSRQIISSQYDLVFSYDVVEHVRPEKLDFAIRNLWSATARTLLVVPATYDHGETSDPYEPTHLIFKPRDWWIDYIAQRIDGRFDQEASVRFAGEYHSKEFKYDHRIIIFSRH